MNIFPFTLPDHAGNSLFQAYVQQHKAELDEKYGEWVYTGKPEREKRWSYAEVKVEALTETSVRFTTYDLALNEQEVLLVNTVKEALAQPIESRKQELATQAYEKRQRELEHAAHKAGVDATYKEMFP